MYRASNANLTSYKAGFRIWIVALIAKLAGVQVHIEGFPFGASSSAKLAHTLVIGCNEASGE